MGLVGLMVVGFGIYAVNQTDTQESIAKLNESLDEISLICTSEISEPGSCNVDTSAAQLAAEQNREVVTFDEIPASVILTTLAAEDRSFGITCDIEGCAADGSGHKGVDPKGLTRAVYRTATGGNVQGGSTITQQLVKLTTENDDATVQRKAEEAALAIQLEKELSKEEILERYLNVIFYGRNGYGAQAASRVYFDKEMNELTLSEAALIATQIRSPGRKPLDNPDLARLRVEAVIDGLEAEGWVSPEDIAAARQEDVVAGLQEYVQAENLGEVRGLEAGSEHFIEAVRQELEVIYDGQTTQGGYRVYTTLDQAKQKQAYDTVYNNEVILDPSFNEANPTFRASVVTIDEQGRVVAMVGGKSFDQGDKFNTATNGRNGNGLGRQPGSTFKPFALAALIEQGNAADSLFEIDLSGKLTIPGADDGKDWVVGGGRSRGAPYLDGVKGLEYSSNHVFAQMALDVTPEEVIRTSQIMGVTKEIEPVVSIALGTKEVAPIDMASAYSTFERDGVALRPVLIERIENADGDILCWYPDSTDERSKIDCKDRPNRDYEPPQAPDRVGDQVIQPQTARNVNYAMEGVVTRGTGNAARVDGRRIAGKTGTTQNNWDAWFVGFSCDATTAVWLGNDANTDLVDQNGSDIGGGGLPATIWSNYMTQYLADAPECDGENWPVSDDFQGEVLREELKIPRVPCFPSGDPQMEDPLLGGRQSSQFNRCIAYDPNNPSDPNNPFNENSPYYVGGPGNPFDDNDNDNDNDNDEEEKKEEEERNNNGNDPRGPVIDLKPPSNPRVTLPPQPEPNNP